ncbi:signal peptidase I [Bacillus carboniphilus]|uniref:Signal peptidase I n=1 Tax=Bacillus carboniphilus TaxID=86663 RepID=A0ABY9JWU6_9BACI|nr:signal peptidase I [Bacillus carboniphilus]WLR42900.1 signal peptidase I [Bacillus carboniphilus]
MSRKFYIILFVTVSVILFVFLIQSSYAQYEVEGISMEPTVHQGHYVVTNQWAYLLTDIERFDIVVFSPSDNEEEVLVKRVVALPGEKLKYEDDQLYINGEPVDEPFLKANQKKQPFGLLTGDFELQQLENTYGMEEIPEGYVFVMGDNRLYSRDSRHFGLIEIDEIIGKVKP